MVQEAEGGVIASGPYQSPPHAFSIEKLSISYHRSDFRCIMIKEPFKILTDTFAQTRTPYGQQYRDDVEMSLYSRFLYHTLGFP